MQDRWGTGSSWENAGWFDVRHRWEALPVVQFMGRDYFGKAQR